MKNIVVVAAALMLAAPAYAQVDPYLLRSKCKEHAHYAESLVEGRDAGLPKARAVQAVQDSVTRDPDGAVIEQSALSTIDFVYSNPGLNADQVYGEVYRACLAGATQ